MFPYPTREKQHNSTLHLKLERQLYNRLLLHSPVQDYLAEQRETEHLNQFWSSHIISIFWTQYVSALVRVFVSSLLFILSNPHNLEDWIMHALCLRRVKHYFRCWNLSVQVREYFNLCPLGSCLFPKPILSSVYLVSSWTSQVALVVKNPPAL